MVKWLSHDKALGHFPEMHVFFPSKFEGLSEDSIPN